MSERGLCRFLAYRSVTYRLLVFAERRMDDTAIEQNLGRVRDAVKRLQCLLKIVVVVAAEGCHPGFDFLPRSQSNGLRKQRPRTAEGAHLLQRHDECSFNVLPGSMVSSSLN